MLNWKKFRYGHYYSGCLSRMMAALENVADEARRIMAFVIDPTLAEIVPDSEMMSGQIAIEMVELMKHVTHDVEEGLIVLLSVYIHTNPSSVARPAIVERFGKICLDMRFTAEIRALANVSANLNIGSKMRNVHPEHLTFALRWLTTIMEEGE